MSKGQKFLHFPLTKIILGTLACLGVVIIGQLSTQMLLDGSEMDRMYQKLIEGMVIVVLAVAGYWLIFRYYEKRAITELSAQRLHWQLAGGFVLGAGLQSLSILVIWLNGSYTIIEINPVIFLLPAFTMALISGVVEEILFRGILFRLIEEKLGSYIALLISAIIFGFLHMVNPNSSFLAGLAIAIQAGLLLGAAYMYTRNLWFPIAIHFAWNFMQSGVYGAATSGSATAKSLITCKIEGIEWITGGAFGPEASIQATVFGIIATVILLLLCHRENKIILPYWKYKSTV